MPELSRIGSGKPDGFTQCLGTRIHELRHDYGYDVRKVRDERVNGQRQTEYQLFRNGLPWTETEFKHSGKFDMNKPLIVINKYSDGSVQAIAPTPQVDIPPLPTAKKIGQGDLFS